MLFLLLQILDLLIQCRKSAGNFWNRSSGDNCLSNFIFFGFLTHSISSFVSYKYAVKVNTAFHR